MKTVNARVIVILQTDDDECSSNPCKNNGQCYDRLYGYICVCGRGLAGPNCEIGKL